MVNEQGTNTANYNSAAASGLEDIYGLADMPFTVAEIDAVVACGHVRRDAAGTRFCDLGLSTGGTVLRGTAAQPSTTGDFRNAVFHTRPGGGAWTNADLAALRYHVRTTA
jgi:hypothetical protein